jgi:hypothetical protein
MVRPSRSPDFSLLSGATRIVTSAPGDRKAQHSTVKRGMAEILRIAV